MKPTIPEGWQLVPKEPTLEMVKASGGTFLERSYAVSWYRAMLTAAPTYSEPARVDACRQFVERVATQKPEKPDHWSTCGQCEHNIEAAQDALEESVSTMHPCAGPECGSIDPKLHSWECFMKYENVISKKTCTEERPCVNCFAQHGACLGPAPAKAPTDQDDRAAFEKHMNSQFGYSTERYPLGGYKRPELNNCWMAWQAALRYARGT